MPENSSRKYTKIVNYVEDQIGADIDRDLLEIAISAQDTDELLVSQADGEVYATDLDKIGGETQSAVDVANKIDKIEDALTSVGGDQLRVDLENYNGGAVPTEQQSPVGVENTAGDQIDPERAVDFPNQQVVGEDLTVDDTVIGPFTVARSEALVLSVNETSGGSINASVDWVDSNGNIFQSESATDIGLSDVSQDWSRLVRKGPQAKVTLSNSNSATSTNAHVDTEK
jgi:hypothetical protein